MTYFKKMNKMNTFQWNYWFQWILKREPSTVQYIFMKNEQNEDISMKSTKLSKINKISRDFQNRAFYRLLYLSEI